MIDTQLILSEIKKLREAMEQLREELKPKRAKPARKANPKLEECEAYAIKLGVTADLGRRFFEHYAGQHLESEDKWLDKNKQPIYNWKHKMKYWRDRDINSDSPYRQHVSVHRPQANGGGLFNPNNFTE